mmetsp:Transcript_54293/g.99360  ORF Transcript_54293/g.99360 Transcript_54293/m.99360 type:complete len:103 (+) Transcript_54293:151-459(+)
MYWTWLPSPHAHRRMRIALFLNDAAAVAVACVYPQTAGKLSKDHALSEHTDRLRGRNFQRRQLGSFCIVGLSVLIRCGLLLARSRQHAEVGASLREIVQNSS